MSFVEWEWYHLMIGSALYCALVHAGSFYYLRRPLVQAKARARAFRSVERVGATGKVVLRLEESSNPLRLWAVLLVPPLMVIGLWLVR